MSLKLISVTNAKTAKDEFVLLQATAKINLQGYAIVDKTFSTNQKISNQFRHIFFFPDVVIEKDEFVMLMTGTGDSAIEKKEKMKDGLYVHPFFWNSSECIWNNNGNDSATLIRYASLQTVKVPAIKE